MCVIRYKKYGQKYLRGFYIDKTSDDKAVVMSLIDFNDVLIVEHCQIRKMPSCLAFSVLTTLCRISGESLIGICCDIFQNANASSMKIFHFFEGADSDVRFDGFKIGDSINWSQISVKNHHNLRYCCVEYNNKA